MDIKIISINALEPNKGQVEGLPKNPRFIRDERFEDLKKSISDFPEGLSLRECIVYPHGKKYVVVGGNMRLRACKELGYTTMPCKVLDVEIEAEKLRRIAIMDNVAYGQNDWDIMANEWDETELAEFGLELDWMTGGIPEAPEAGNAVGNPEGNEDGQPAAPADTNQEQVQIVFRSAEDKERFVAAYKDVIEADYSCIFLKY